MKIQRLTIDCNGFEGNLCRRAGEFGTDKSVLNTSVRDGARGPHRHAYTPVYQMLFATKRFARLRIAEIGIETGAGTRMLRAYFPHAALFGFERNNVHIQTCQALGLPGVVYLPIDVTQEASIAAAFRSAQDRFDIVIDDATHRPEDQARVIEAVYPFLELGGTLIVEDIFENAAEEIFEEAVASLELAFSAFVFPEHRALSRGWKNDKLLILVK